MFNQAQSSVDAAQKKIIFKVLTSVKDSQNKCSVEEVWGAFLKRSERETLRAGTQESLVKDKEELINIVEALERDNMIMYAAEDNQIILI